jgi:hypothetical protein
MVFSDTRTEIISNRVLSKVMMRNLRGLLPEKPDIIFEICTYSLYTLPIATDFMNWLIKDLIS